MSRLTLKEFLYHEEVEITAKDESRELEQQFCGKTEQVEQATHVSE